MCWLFHIPGAFAARWKPETSIRSPPPMSSSWVCPPFLAQVPQLPWESLSTRSLLSRGKEGVCPLGCQHPIPAAPYPCSLGARAVLGSCSRLPGSLTWRACVPCSPCIDLINEEPPMVFSTLLSVKITF